MLRMISTARAHNGTLSVPTLAAMGRDRPDRLFQVELFPPRPAGLARPGGGQDQKFQRPHADAPHFAKIGHEVGEVAIVHRGMMLGRGDLATARQRIFQRPPVGGVLVDVVLGNGVVDMAAISARRRNALLGTSSQIGCNVAKPSCRAMAAIGSSPSVG